jgi:hypothetical protein
VTFADGVLRLVRAGARVDPEGRRAAARSSGYPDSDASGDDYSGLPRVVALESPISMSAATAQADAPDDGASVGPLTEADTPGFAAEPSMLEPGFADIEAAVALVETGLASRVVLSGFPSWPGLLWQAYQLAESANVLILPTVVRPGGRVDIVIARDNRTDG